MNGNVGKNLANFFSLIFFVVMVGCAGTGIPPIVTYEQAKQQVDKGPALIDPPIEERQMQKEGETRPIDKGEAALENGHWIDQDKGNYYKLIKAERDRVRMELEAARKKEAVQKIIYESTIEHIKAKAEKRNTWWEQNKGIVGLAFGTTVGMAIVTGLVYALTKGKAVEQN